MGPLGRQIVEKVEEGLNLAGEGAEFVLELDDRSHLHRGHAGVRGHEGGETHFHLYCVSPKFEGLSAVKRQQLVYGLLKVEFKAGLHALELTLKTPKEIQKT